MYRVTKEIEFCYGHRLLDYDGKCRYLHGHNGVAEITFEARELDGRGMVIDFADLQRLLKTWIDGKLDHRMILRRDDPVVPPLVAAGEPVHLLDVNPTAENLAKLIYDHAKAEGHPVVNVRLRETPSSIAEYSGGPRREGRKG